MADFYNKLDPTNSFNPGIGKTINVISLAGIAFAVGMVVDAAIVVLENIFRLKEKGMPTKEAAFKGTSQVWQAVMVSALTTVLVFVPILIMELEAGQLLQDIAVAISVAVLMSLIVSATILPALTYWILSKNKSSSFFKIALLDNIGTFTSTLILKYVKAVIISRKSSMLIVSLLIVSTLGLSYLMLPKLEYLPEGNRNLIFGVMLPPPGYNLKTLTDIANSVEKKVENLWSINTGDKAEAGKPPKIKNFFFEVYLIDKLPLYLQWVIPLQPKYLQLIKELLDSVIKSRKLLKKMALKTQ